MDFSSKIWILDGAMGTMIQRRGISDVDYRGNNDILNVLRPDVIKEIHLEYLAAGADIITTNTFNANSISQCDYGWDGRVREINLAGAKAARDAVDAFATQSGDDVSGGRRILVAGSMGPTNKMLFLSPDMAKPEFRAVGFDEMADAYKVQAQALIDGGADMLLVETVFDVLNAKAAIYAIRSIDEDFPIMLSASINDRSGRLLSGHTLSALYTAVSRYRNIISFGLNCSFGAKDLEPFIAQISQEVSCGVSVYPNAGLPNELGSYDESPDYTASCIADMAEKGLVNIVGGCCGTTPDHIRAIADKVRGYKPRLLPIPCPALNTGSPLTLSGQETLIVDRKRSNFTNIGERTNVSGSAKFAKLIESGDYSEASSIARRQIEGGATVIDINVDAPMLDSPSVMADFLRVINNDPDIAKVPYMIDSSNWETIVSGLKNCGGKPVVNSISLKEGEKEFLRKASEIYELGGAVIVMAFDEEGQATSYQRKIDICTRAYRLLIDKVGFVPSDIIFDVNILTIATGLKEHDDYAIDFIKAVKWIKENLPGCKTSGGVSNLSFAFRGNNGVREAIHSVFLYHAINAGLDMAIVNPSMLQVYDEIEPELLKAVEDVVLNRHLEGTDTPTDVLVSIAQRIKEKSASASEQIHSEPQWRTGSIESRLEYALIKGNADYIEQDLKEALPVFGTAVSIIEGPLMGAMDKVGSLFEEGKMFLPQVVKSAKVMKSAVGFLQPLLTSSESSASVGKHGKILLATAKGDVHDIGKNIVSIVLSCNGFDVIDMGVMVEGRDIIERAIAEKADIIGISGLISPSLLQMESLCRMISENAQVILEKVGHSIPLVVGGATTSAVHTAVKLAPILEGVSDKGFLAVYGGDASRTAGICKRLYNSTNSSAYAEGVRAEQYTIRENYLKRNTALLSAEEARAAAPKFSPESFILPDGYGENNLFVKNLNIGEIAGMIDWTAFLNFWGFRGTYPSIIYSDTEEGRQAEKLYEQAVSLLGSAIASGEFEASGILNFYDAYSEGDEIVADHKLRLLMPRQLELSSEHLSLADYFPAYPSSSVLGLFALKVEDLRSKDFDHKSFEYLLRHSICARLTEALAGWMTGKTVGEEHYIRPAFGYPVCPDHSLKKTVIEYLEAERHIGIRLTESYALVPETAICGMLIVHPQAKYFDCSNK